MKLNCDYSKRVVVRSGELDWLPSPTAGVDRKMMERDGEELARATSIVRYAKGSRFPEHRHPGGEEILVLEGVFQDETGDYPVGSYLKNPAGTSHAPASDAGCTLFVKLMHLHPDDQQVVRKNWKTADWRPGLVDGLSVLPLDEFETTHTALVRWAPGTQFNFHRHMGGEEIFVIEGSLEDEHGLYTAGDWIRSPHASTHKPASPQGCLIFVKVGHLPLAQA
ncbi:MAG: cupin domain-containing protein [Limnobacter sp.]|nr:cupin domain-containing protein [Limnobacter sp.]